MNKNKFESGQSLLVVIFAITLGLVTLVSVSMRVVSSTKRVFIDNAYYKAQAVAEAGAEKFLLKTNSELEVLKASCTTSLYTQTGFANSIPASCTLDTAGGFTEARAVMAVETIPSGSIYETSSPANSTISVNLEGATGEVEICWRAGGPVGSEYSEVLSFYYYKNGGVNKLKQQKNVCGSFITWYSNKPAGSWTSDGIPASGMSGDYACFLLAIDSADTPQLLNLMSLVNESSYRITFRNTSPTEGQGYRITSVGEVKSAGGGSLAGSAAARKKVVVEKSRLPNLGPWFNFAVASESGKIVAE